MQRRFITILFLSLFISTNVLAAAKRMSMDQGDNGGFDTPNMTLVSGGQYAGGSCRVACGGESAVKADIQNKCMCVGSRCFRISIGYKGYLMTTSGTGIMGVAIGSVYQTQPGPGTTAMTKADGTADNDAISMGIAANTTYGKWIHKAPGCRYGQNNTAGCIGVPCDMWPLVKAQMGKSLTVCNANQFPSSQGVSVTPSGRIKFNSSPQEGNR